MTSLVSAGNRDEVDDVIIMVTDGKPTRDVEMLDDEVKKLMEDGIYMIAIGVGQADEAFLETLVASPSDYYYLLDFPELRDITGLVAAQICGEEHEEADGETTEQPDVPG